MDRIRSCPAPRTRHARRGKARAAAAHRELQGARSTAQCPRPQPGTAGAWDHRNQCGQPRNCRGLCSRRSGRVRQGSDDRDGEPPTRRAGQTVRGRGGARRERARRFRPRRADRAGGRPIADPSLRGAHYCDGYRHAGFRVHAASAGPGRTHRADRRWRAVRRRLQRGPGDQPELPCLRGRARGGRLDESELRGRVAAGHRRGSHDRRQPRCAVRAAHHVRNVSAQRRTDRPVLRSPDTRVGHAVAPRSPTRPPMADSPSASPAPRSST